MIQASPIPYSLVRATQFFEFVGGIAQSATDGETVRLPHTLFQPIASDDVAAALTDVSTGQPLNRMVELAGPESLPLDECVSLFLRESGDPRKVVTDDMARYFGIAINDQSLRPGNHPRLGTTHFADWLSRSLQRK